jgi:hypothetical protein
VISVPRAAKHAQSRAESNFIDFWEIDYKTRVIEFRFRISNLKVFGDAGYG